MQNHNTSFQLQSSISEMNISKWCRFHIQNLIRNWQKQLFLCNKRKEMWVEIKQAGIHAKEKECQIRYH